MLTSRRLQSVVPLLASYSAVQCSPGYEGVLCGSCAPGFGSTAPAQCRRCPPRALNDAYYGLAVLLTLAILAVTIRSLLTQSLLAARQARGERKVEVLGELRLMGRPLINPSLIAVLNDDELPDEQPSRPIYGKSLPPSLEGLVSLRQAFQSQRHDLNQSTIDPGHWYLHQQQQQEVQQQQQQQQQQEQEAILSTASGSYRSGGGGVGSQFGTNGGASATAAISPLPLQQRLRGWSTRRLMGSVVPIMGDPPSQEISLPPPQPSPHHVMPPAFLAPIVVVLREDPSGGGGPGSALATAAAAATASPRAASLYAGICQSVASSPFTSRSGRAAPTLDFPAGSTGSGKPYDEMAVAAVAPFAAGASLMSVAAKPPATWPGGIDGGCSETKPSVAAAPAGDGGAAAATDTDADIDTGVDCDPRDSAQERPQYGGSPLRLRGRGGCTVRLPLGATRHSHEGSSAAAAAAAVAVGVPMRRRVQSRPGLASALAGSPVPSGPVVAAAMAAAAGANFSGGRQASVSGPAGGESRGPRFDPGLGHMPSRTTSATAVLRRSWLGLSSGVNADFPQRQPSVGGIGAGGALVLSPRMVSVTGMPSPFIAEVRRRQSRADGAAGGGGRGISRRLLGGWSRLRRHAEDGSGGEIETTRSGNGSSSHSLLNIGAVLRRRLATPSSLAAAAPTIATDRCNVSRTGSMDADRLATVAASGATAYGSSAHMYGGGGSVHGVSTYGGPGASGYGGGGASGYGYGGGAASGYNGAVAAGGGATPSGTWRYGEYDVDEFGPDEEVLGTPVLLSTAATPRGPPPPLPPPPPPPAAGAISPVTTAGGGGNTFVRDTSGDANPLQDAATIKIFISYVQILALVKAVPLPDLPASVTGYLRFYDQLTAIPGSLVSLDCSLPDPARLGPGGGLSKAAQRTLLAALAPLYVSLAVAAVWVVIAVGVYGRERSKWRSRPAAIGPVPVSGLLAFARSYLPPRLVMSSATVMFYFYPNTVRALLSIFSCVDVDSADAANPLAAAAGLHTGKYWTLDYSERCYVGRHLALALGLGMSGLLLLGVGWPVGVALWLARKGRVQALDFSDFSMVVYASYRELYQLRYLYWESVIMLRQMVVAVVVVLLAQRGVAVQVLVVVALVAGAFAAQLLVQPFRTRSMNRLEEVSLVVIMITLYLNLYLVSPAVTFAGRTVLAICIIGINAVMLAVFVYFITRTSWEKQLDTMGLDRHRVYDMDPNEIRSSLRRRYSPRTAALLTRVVTSAQTLKTVKASLYHTGSLMRRTVASSLKRDGESAAAAAAAAVHGGGGSAKSLVPAPDGALDSGTGGGGEQKRSSGERADRSRNDRGGVPGGSSGVEVAGSEAAEGWVGRERGQSSGRGGGGWPGRPLGDEEGGGVGTSLERGGPRLSAVVAVQLENEDVSGTELDRLARGSNVS